MALQVKIFTSQYKSFSNMDFLQKSHLQLSTSLLHLGVVINTEACNVYFSQEQCYSVWSLELVTGCYVLIFTENVATKAHINCQGGIHSRSLMLEAEQLGRVAHPLRQGKAHLWNCKCAECTEQSLPKELLGGLKLEEVVDLRLKEVLHIRKEQKYLGVLLDMLRKVQCYLKVDLTEVEQKHSKNLAEKTLDDVVKVRGHTSCNDDRIETHLHLSERLKSVSEVFCAYNASHIFSHCWEEAAKMLRENMEDSGTEETLAIEDVFDCVFDPCFKEFKRIYDSLKLGDLTFAEVNVLSKDFKNDYKELRSDFKIMCRLQHGDNGEWIDERIQQIQQYHELGLALDSAKVIDKVKDVLKLSGDFSVLQLLLNLAKGEQGENGEQEAISDDGSSNNIRKINVGNKNELKVFVELASISAGENDMEVDRVACFHDAVFGYSSLLYDLKRGAGFKEFMKCLKNIWKALESDCNLPTKLRDSARYLDWLKTIKESHGSVELSSISLATSINEKGIYRIKAPEEGQKVCLDTVLNLTVKESHGDQEKTRHYSLEELQELMNKLMLMSGKEEQSAQVEKFSERRSIPVYWCGPYVSVFFQVQTGISEFLFKLFILRYLEDADGKIWLRKQCHLYVAEILQPPHSPKKQRGSKFPGLNYSFLDVFPQITCRSPKEVLCNGSQENLFHDSSDPGVDQGMFCSEAFQRPFQYLLREHRRENLDAFKYRKGSVEGTPEECLQLLLMYCGVIDPSWSELRNFAWFLNLQLKNCETSVFCNAAFVQDTLQGFKNFVVKFMILMAKDFATPSLNISDESPGMQVFEDVTEEALAPFLLRKKWESEPHPYIFFNEDCVSMTFIGFHLQHNNNGSIDAINPLNGNIIKRNVMTLQLYMGLALQRVPFNIDFDALTRAEKIEKLCMVLGIQWPTDPDETYELTTDNILKMLAIEMRFRCGIPVVLMGETGCGKTRLIKYLCELRKSGADADNMKLVKVHGGTTADAIYDKVREAEDMAQCNRLNYKFDTILFFDEANTTDAVSSIKEVLCDHTIEGQPLLPNMGLQIIAACNPYRKHTPKMIQRLESAGLGYRVKAEDTSEKLGSIPLRQLVYRVHALPPSMIPLVWDFGQLNNITEKLYIEQIVQKLAKSITISATEVQMITEVLFKSQTYMRQRKDECSFISLRDVERCVEVFKWFHGHSERLIEHLERSLESNPPKSAIQRDRIMWSLILSVGVCYHASLEKKEAYWRIICKIFPEPYDNEKVVLEEISLIQDLFLSGVPDRQSIAKNMALKENVFMMVICIELKIPLFLIGKPGSSKSLAKTIVADAMQGPAAYSDLYKELKQIHLVSFQCSPHSTPEGIINTFKHCARFQEGKNLGEYVSVVVLDEIGLAEDSPKMPLKTLHPLLEDGCIDDDPLPHKKVGFVGISNWALDPAKMNRGIFVSRGNLNKNELIKSAKGICSSEPLLLQKIECFFPIFANAYEEICKSQTKDFFGLRDYYSLVKMLFALTKNSKSIPGPHEIAEVVLRNFSGKEGVEVLDTFMSKIPEGGDENYKDINTIDLVEQNICSNYQEGECRYLLVLTENYAALQILQQRFFRDTQPEIIFGSSFPKDQEYTQICRNINRVKICMETGKMVVLLNLQNLYESLYDALNQYYVQLAGQKYIDLGLGTHRVKCRVHPKFRLIVIEEKKVVYEQFPIPLINRLEKHYLDINTVLNKWQKTIVEVLKKWVDDFVTVKTEKYFMGQQTYKPSDVFIGYNSDSCASVVLQVTENLKESLPPAQLSQKVQEQSEMVLLNCATPDSVIRLGDSKLDFLSDSLAKIYFQQQQHTSFAEFLHRCLRSDSGGLTVFIEMTTFSRLLTAADTEILEAELQHNSDSLKVLFLQQFDTEYSFLKDIRNFFAVRTDGSKILIIQTDFENGSLSAQLIASARYSAVNEVNKIQENQARVFIIFITKLSRIEGGSSYIGFHGGLWQSVHIDDLRTSKDMISDITALRNITISQLFSENTGESAENPETAGMKEEEETEEKMEVEVSPISEPEIFILDTTILLRSCVQSAVSMLRDHNEDAGRSAERIAILLKLLSEEDTPQGNFLKITKSRLTYLLKNQE
ncbi:PREDICTED: E3 ubiquitin-protein ligase RNF213-like, partial [Thamnophis sirtalis]|uniref:RING-type E3 ubiquitin transferase n=1 Tax=Thamnophis sirtalis TaxID=35019 RepID=A0A6I9XZH3_9SAUR